MLHLTEDEIRRHATDQSFRRGRAYLNAGAVRSVVERGGELHGQVEGSDFDPYQVRVRFDEAGVMDAACTCPYTWGGWCKHVVAVLLAVLYDPEAVETRPALESLLQEMTREQLIDLVRILARADPDLAERVEAWNARHPQAEEVEAGSRRSPIDGRAIRRRVKSALHALDRMRPSEAYWHVAEVVAEVRRELEPAQAFVAAGDGRTALVILDALTDAYVAEWTVLDDSDGGVHGFFEELGPVWTEALLTADLTAEERAEWAARLADWQDALQDYGLDEALWVAIAAAEQGWDDPDLRGILDGHETPVQEVWDVEESWCARELIEARLRVLERQGRTDAYLRLAAAEGRTEAYVTMLARLGRLDEAVEEGLRTLDTSHGTLALAQILRERGDVAGALRIGRHGLAFEGFGRVNLATWVCDLARGLGDGAAALEAALVAYRAAPGLDAYNRVRDLVGDDWPEHRDALLEYLRTPKAGPEARVAIYLQEGLLDDAIATADQFPHYDLVRRVAPAVVEERPEWVIRAASRQAEAIMDEGKSALYDYAVDWLKQVRTAYRRAGRASDWDAYLASLGETHRRKYKLMRLIGEQLT